MNEISNKKIILPKNITDVLKILKYDELALKFFIVFSRFEYALKRAGYVKRKYNSIIADWDRFATDFNKPFDLIKTNELKIAVDYLKQYPPKIQDKEDYSLVWKESKLDIKQSLLSAILIYIRRVRNNLFHGGKFPGDPIHDPARDQILLTKSLIIIDACLELDSSIKSFFMLDNE